MGQTSWRGCVGGLVLLAAVSAVGAAEPLRLVHVQVADRAEQDRVGEIINLEELTRGFDLYGWATPDELEELGRQGYSFEVVPEEKDVRALTMCTDSGGPPFEPPFPWDCYPTYGQFLDMMDYWATAYPSIVRKVNLGASTSGAHDLWTLKISDNPDTEEDEPEIFYTATMHGDELVCYPTTLHLIDHILQNYGSDPQITALVNGAELWVNPMANPDGTFNGTDTSVASSTRYIPGAGVDPNRNFPDPAEGDHPDGSAWATETLAMMAFADARSLVLSANCHSGAEVVNYPWDTWSARHADDACYQTVSHVYADSAQAASPSGYMSGFDDGITNGYDWYRITGGRQDYMNFVHGCREVTLELSDEKWLDAGLLDDHFDYNRDALLGYFDQAFDGIRGIVTDAVSGDPVAATVKVVGHDIVDQQTWVFTDPDVGDYHRMIETGTWDLEFTADGYETTTATGIVVTHDASTRRDVQMTALASYSISGVVTDASTGLPISGALAELTDTSLDAVMTNGSGAYTIAGVWEGVHTLDVTAAGYGAYEEQITVGAASTVFDVELAPVQTAFDEDFEADDGGFTAAGSWQWGTDAVAGAASGAKVWGTVIGNVYGANNADWTLDSPEIVLANDLNSALLEFAHWFEMEDGYDGGQVLVSVDGGAFSLVTPVDGYTDQSVSGLGSQPGFTGGSSGWTTATVDLGPNVGHTVVVRWRFGTDYSENQYQGWYIDDVQVLTTGGTPPPPPFFADGFESGETSGWSETIGGGS